MAVDPFAELLRHLRRSANRTQDEQAGAINAASGRATMTRREVNRYENGANVPTDHTLGNIALACGVPLEPLLREAKAARARRRKKNKAEAEDLDDVKRRTLLGGAVIGAAAAAEPWGRLACALSKGSKIDPESAGVLIDHAARLHVDELNESALSLQSRVEAHLDAITAALPQAGTHERALTIAAGETAALAGWVAWDLGEHDKATSYYGVASECARKAGHPPSARAGSGLRELRCPQPCEGTGDAFAGSSGRTRTWQCNRRSVGPGPVRGGGRSVRR
ncbi:helix-turn-helix domain-containing protein [Streptomyces sp. NPDC057387]|uniref:helix-turn-helix domain-containing protein n=1 Tax=Streptomyces sp. NPDC057387 TaxID=3346115 RepID=UPI0036331561